MRESRDVYSVFMGKPEGRRPLGRPRCRCEDNIKMDLWEVGCGGMDWINLAEGRYRWQALVNAVMNLQVLHNVGNFLTIRQPVSLLRSSLVYVSSNICVCISETEAEVGY
jgi:hypothetical protein